MHINKQGGPHWFLVHDPPSPSLSIPYVYTNEGNGRTQVNRGEKKYTGGNHQKIAKTGIEGYIMENISYSLQPTFGEGVNIKPPTPFGEGRGGPSPMTFFPKLKSKLQNCLRVF